MKKILLFFIAALYLFLSTGVTLLQTHCLCSDSTRISLYADPESCREIIPGHDCCEQGNHRDALQTNPPHPFCGCDKPIVTYLKLTDHLGEGSDLEYPNAKPLYLDHFPIEILLQKIVFSPAPKEYSDYSPPQNPLFGRDLVTFLHQRKIAPAA